MISPVSAVSSRRHLRSAGQGDLVMPRTRTTGFGPRSFSVVGPLACNSLPPEIKATSLTSGQFCGHRLKTECTCATTQQLRVRAALIIFFNFKTCVKHKFCSAQNPIHTFPRNFPVDGEAANLLRTCCRLVSDTANKSATSPQQVVSWNLGNDTTQQTQRTFARANLLTDLLRGNCCNGLWCGLC